MSKDWVDALVANSGLPNDELTFTDGSNYGLDGYHFDQTMNEGVMDGARLPETKGLSKLPDGFVGDYERTAEDEMSMVDEVDGLDLGAYLDENAIEKTASLTDLGWLDPTRPQDPDRLPVNPKDKGIAMLEEAWGVNRRTDGIQLVPNKDKEILDYEMTLQTGPQSGLPQGEEVKKTALWALRRAANGMTPTAIKKIVVARLGHQAKALRGVIAQIEADHGLAGNVFIYAAAYDPDIHKGPLQLNLKKHIRRMRAKYVVVPPGEQRLAVWEAIGKTPVTKVPWKKALAHYAAGLTSAGYRIASEGDPREILRRAFLRGPVEVEHVPMEKPRDVRPAETVSVREAVNTFRTAEAVPRQALNNSSKIEELHRKKALVQIAKWVKAGHLDLEAAHKLARSQVSPQMILRTATLLVQANTAASASAYEGIGNQFKTKTGSVTKEAAWASLHAAEAAAKEKAQDLEIAQKQKLGTMLTGMIRKGLLTKGEAIKLGKLDRPVEEILKLAAAAAQTTRPTEMPTPVEREYRGALVEAAAPARQALGEFTPEERQIHAASRKSGIKAQEFKDLVKWARIQMSEGAAGDELDGLLRLRFSGPLRKAASKLLKAVRQEHEGLSGHLYVDAGAYASATGTKGCEKGARTHRSGGLKAVLEIPRCAGCTLKNADGVCTAYNKPLVDGPPAQDPTAYQRKAIQAANSTDAEVTASLFTNNYDSGEYALTDPLQDIGFEEATSPEELGEILFGGMEL